MLFTNLLLALLPATLVSGTPTHQQSRSRVRAQHVRKADNVADSSSPSLHKRYRATFYDVGLGACGWYNNAGDYIVALNSAQFGGSYPSPQCGKSIVISANGIQVGATIADECPTCGYGELDLSRGLFDRFASEDAGTFDMTWWFTDGSGGSGGGQQQQQQQQQPSTTEQPPTSTYVAPPPPSSTGTPTSTYPPSSTTQAPSTTFAPGSSSASMSSNSTAIPFAVTTSAAETAETPGESSTVEQGLGNLVLFNQAVTYLGHIVVVGAGRK